MNDRHEAPDVLVVGGGIVGCTVALAAARGGCVTTLLERGELAREATWAAGGMLAPLAEASGPGPFLDLGLASLARYPEFVRSVEAAVDRTVDFRRDGKLILARDGREERRLRRRLEWIGERDRGAEWLDPEGVRHREPLLTDDLRGALLLPDEARVDNRLLGRAVAKAAGTAGARIRTGCRVARILRHGDRITGVALAGGERVEAERVVVAAGAWSGRLDGLPRTLPVRPVRGQMLAVAPRDGELSTVVDSGRVYLVPRRDGRIVAGSTMEEAGFRSAPTAEGVAGLLERVVDAAPSLADGELVETWAGLRPATPDGLPILGPDPDLEGLYYATGHFRNGILLAPVTADCLGPLLTGRGRPPVDLDPFRVDRFGRRAAVGEGA